MTATQAGAALASAHTTATDPGSIVDELVAQLAPASTDPALVMFFCAHSRDGAAVADGLAGRLPAARVIGCSTAGEFTERAHGRGGAVAVAFPRRVAPTVATALVDMAAGVVPAVNAAVTALEEQLGRSLRDLDPERYVGIVLIDGLTGHEEEVNEALGAVAPFLSFVGGSAGDDLEFRSTWVAAGGQGVCAEGVALAVVEVAVPFTVLKTCSFEPTDRMFTVTRCDAATRTLYELDERPVLDVYAEAVGVSREQLDTALFMAHPFGVMIDDEPWIRSPQQVTPDGGLKLYCQLPQDSKIHVMATTDLVRDTRTAVDQARTRIGDHIGGALLFNCILRRLELDADNRHEEFLSIFAGIPTGGFHTYGESWVGHINQTCTGLILG